MMSFINELEVLGAEIDNETKVDAILSSLPDSFNLFVLNSNMKKMSVSLPELLNMLQSAQELIIKDKPVFMIAEKMSDLKLKPKVNSFQRSGKGSKALKGAGGKGKDKNKSKGNCFHCGKPGHWKRNCRVCGTKLHLLWKSWRSGLT